MYRPFDQLAGCLFDKLSRNSQQTVGQHEVVDAPRSIILHPFEDRARTLTRLNTRLRLPQSLLEFSKTLTDPLLPSVHDCVVPGAVALDAAVSTGSDNRAALTVPVAGRAIDPCDSHGILDSLMGSVLTPVHLRLDCMTYLTLGSLTVVTASAIDILDRERGPTPVMARGAVQTAHLDMWHMRELYPFIQYGLGDLVTMT